MSSTNAAAAAARLASVSGHLVSAPKAGDRFEFDYVIVGGGTAGAVLANRLTENKNVSVAVIEGGPSDVGLDVALNLGRWLEMLEGPYDYDYTTTEQPRGNSNIHHSRARMLGGCSSHNTLISFRPLKEDLDWWAQQHNCPSWAANKIQPYGDRLKLNTVPVQGQHRNEITRDWVKATSEACEAPIIDDFNAAIVHNDGFASGGGNGVGFLSISYDPYSHDRSSASTAYLHPIMAHAGRSARRNLHLFLETWAEKLVFDPSDAKRVSGVECLSGVERHRFSIHAKKDVIVCAGAIDSPRLLLLSGIGPKAELEKVGVPVKHDLPGVGKHLSDHPETICMWSVGEKDAPKPDETVMTSDAAFFLRVPSEHEPSEELHKKQPNLMAHCYQVVFGMNLEPMGYKLPPYAFCMTPNIPRSQARGEITLRSSNPQDKPLIDFNYFEDERKYDERILVEGIKACRKIAQTEPLKHHLLEEIAPGPKVQTDEEISAFARAAHHTVYHPSGTCRMGTPGAVRQDGIVTAEQGKPDATVVVDQKDLKVVGLKGLRVCDASVLPVLPTVNPMLTILMVAERTADIIKQEQFSHNVPLP